MKKAEGILIFLIVIVGVSDVISDQTIDNFIQSDSSLTPRRKRNTRWRPHHTRPSWRHQIIHPTAPHLSHLRPNSPSPHNQNLGFTTTNDHHQGNSRLHHNLRRSKKRNSNHRRLTRFGMPFPRRLHQHLHQNLHQNLHHRGPMDFMHRQHRQLMHNLRLRLSDHIARMRHQMSSILPHQMNHHRHHQHHRTHPHQHPIKTSNHRLHTHHHKHPTSTTSTRNEHTTSRYMKGRKQFKLKRPPKHEIPEDVEVFRGPLSSTPWSHRPDDRRKDRGRGKGTDRNCITPVNRRPENEKGDREDLPGAIHQAILKSVVSVRGRPTSADPHLIPRLPLPPNVSILGNHISNTFSQNATPSIIFRKNNRNNPTSSRGLLPHIDTFRPSKKLFTSFLPSHNISQGSFRNLFKGSIGTWNFTTPKISVEEHLNQPSPTNRGEQLPGSNEEIPCIKCPDDLYVEAPRGSDCVISQTPSHAFSCTSGRWHGGLRTQVLKGPLEGTRLHEGTYAMVITILTDLEPTPTTVTSCDVSYHVQVHKCPPFPDPLPEGLEVECTAGRAWGSRCKWRCRPGFTLKGAHTTACVIEGLATSSSNRQYVWTHSAPTCSASSPSTSHPEESETCPPPPPIVGGHYVCMDADESFREPHIPSGSRKDVPILKDDPLQTGGTIRYPKDTYRHPTDAHRFPRRFHEHLREVHVDNEDALNRRKPPGTVCEIHCGRGRVVALSESGRTRLTCTRQGRWDQKPPRCRPKVMPQPLAGECEDVYLLSQDSSPPTLNLPGFSTRESFPLTVSCEMQKITSEKKSEEVYVRTCRAKDPEMGTEANCRHKVVVLTNSSRDNSVGDQDPPIIVPTTGRDGDGEDVLEGTEGRNHTRGNGGDITKNVDDENETFSEFEFDIKENVLGNNVISGPHTKGSGNKAEIRHSLSGRRRNGNTDLDQRVYTDRDEAAKIAIEETPVITSISNSVEISGHRRNPYDTTHYTTSITKKNKSLTKASSSQFHNNMPDPRVSQYHKVGDTTQRGYLETTQENPLFVSNTHKRRNFGKFRSRISASEGLEPQKEGEIEVPDVGSNSAEQMVISTSRELRSKERETRNQKLQRTSNSTNNPEANSSSTFMTFPQNEPFGANRMLNREDLGRERPVEENMTTEITEEGNINGVITENEVSKNEYASAGRAESVLRIKMKLTQCKNTSHILAILTEVLLHQVICRHDLVCHHPQTTPCTVRDDGWMIMGIELAVERKPDAHLNTHLAAGQKVLQHLLVSTRTVLTSRWVTTHLNDLGAWLDLSTLRVGW